MRKDCPDKGFGIADRSQVAERRIRSIGSDALDKSTRSSQGVGDGRHIEKTNDCADQTRWSSGRGSEPATWNSSKLVVLVQ